MRFLAHRKGVSSYTGDHLLELFRMNIQSGFRPDYEIGVSDFLVDRPLSLDAALTRKIDAEVSTSSRDCERRSLLEGFTSDRPADHGSVLCGPPVQGRRGKVHG